MPKSRKVAVVDDDDGVRRALGRLLTSAGFSALTFGSAQQFLDDSRQRDVDCMVIDVRMPEMDGLELQARVAASGLSVPTIFITAHADPEVEARARAGDAVAFLHKPFEDSALLDAVGNALSKWKTR